MNIRLSSKARSELQLRERERIGWVGVRGTPDLLWKVERVSATASGYACAPALSEPLPRLLSTCVFM